jgi:FLVCR family MFS transporter 7
MAAAVKEIDGGSGDRIGLRTTDDKKRDRSPVAAMLSNGHGNGWRVLKDGEDVPNARDVEDGSGSAVPIEPRETGSSSAMPGDGDEDVGEGNGGDVVVYKVYKRRWFGLVQLVLLNIIVSWDVSSLSWRLPPSSHSALTTL